MKILFLYAEVMGYTMAMIRELVESGADVHVVHFDTKKLTPYQMPVCKNIYFYPRSTQNFVSLRKLADEINPSITVVSGWSDKAYLGVAFLLRRQGRIVVTGLDAQWKGGVKQCVTAALGKFKFFSCFFSHAWVAGVFQYEYAKKLGFNKHDIVFDIYAADLNLFHSAYKAGLEIKSSSYPKRFLFVGRFEAVKGLDVLLAAWEIIGSSKSGWELHLIGNGGLKSELASVPGVVVKDFMQPDNLVNEILGSGCFILPSRDEPWGVVVHEFAAAGLPLILSDAVGSASAFLVQGMNGYLFRVNDVAHLAERMRTIIATANRDLLEMSKDSHSLSTRITPKTAAMNLLSLMDAY